MYYTTCIVVSLFYCNSAVNTVKLCARKMEITLTQPCWQHLSLSVLFRYYTAMTSSTDFWPWVIPSRDGWPRPLQVNRPFRSIPPHWHWECSAFCSKAGRSRLLWFSCLSEMWPSAVISQPAVHVSQVLKGPGSLLYLLNCSFVLPTLRKPFLSLVQNRPYC